MRKRLYFDIETAPNIGFFWQSGYKLNIGYENIIKERAIICICYKWDGQSKVYSLTWDSKQSDKKMLKSFIKVANQSSEMIGHNGDSFDIKWIRTRCLYHDIDMMPNYVTIDTLKEARKGFRFNSNRLDYISKFTGSKGKLKTSFDLWKDICLKNCKTSLNYMVKYCKADVVELERVFGKLNKYIKPKTTIAEYKCECPECGERKIRLVRRNTSASGNRVIQIQCLSCGKHHTVPVTSYEKAIKMRDWADKKALERALKNKK